MDLTLAPSTPPLAPRRHYLLIGLAISVLLHAGLLAWRMSTPAPPRPQASGLEITLVNARSDTPPEHPQVLAQQDMDGGGNARAGISSTPLPRTGEAPDTIVLQAMRERQMQLEAEQTRLLTQLQAQEQAEAARSAVHPWDGRQNPGQALQDQAGAVQNAQIATLSSRVQAYNALPRKTFVAPAAQASRYAAYLDGWRTRIETVGTQHFPEQARGRLYGTLRITVTVRSDGSLADFEIDEPSPHAVLNQAARRIVQLAAPFAPFPPELARDTDLLVITRSWHFVNDSLETSAP